MDGMRKVRMMLPMKVRCCTCGAFIYKGTKFNARKEEVAGEIHLDIQIYRFYFKCSRCCAEIIMKTNPQNLEYIVESGASTNFTEEEEIEENRKMRKAELRRRDALKNRAFESEGEIDVSAALDEMKLMAYKH